MPADAPYTDMAVRRGGRLVALGMLAAASDARARRAAQADPEALHDLRVAVRRLRSWLRAIRRQLGNGISRKSRRRLRKLTRSSGASRDIEVHVAWLAGVRPTLRSQQRPGLDRLAARLEERKAGAERKIGGALATFDRWAARLERELDEYQTVVRVREPELEPTLAAAASDVIARHADGLVDALGRVEAADDEEEAHAARIAGKRLRYLIEPFAEDSALATDVVQRLKLLQDTLGELHDAHRLAAEVACVMEETAAEQARRVADEVLDGTEPADAMRAQRDLARPGLLAVARLLRERTQELFATLERDWLRGGGERLVGDAHAVARELAAREPATAC